jgi:hypothetical protein
MLHCGSVAYLWTSPALRQQLSVQYGFPLELEWKWRRSLRTPPMIWWSPVYNSRPSGRAYVAIPLWAPWLFAAAGTFLLWFRDRTRVAPGNCPTCNYDRRGLSAARPCPECGAVPAPSEPTNR